MGDLLFRSWKFWAGRQSLITMQTREAMTEWSSVKWRVNLTIHQKREIGGRWRRLRLRVGLFQIPVGCQRGTGGFVLVFEVEQYIIMVNR